MLNTLIVIRVWHNIKELRKFNHGTVINFLLYWKKSHVKFRWPEYKNKNSFRGVGAEIPIPTKTWIPLLWQKNYFSCSWLIYLNHLQSHIMKRTHTIAHGILIWGSYKVEEYGTTGKWKGKLTMRTREQFSSSSLMFSQLHGVYFSFELISNKLYRPHWPYSWTRLHNGLNQERAINFNPYIPQKVNKLYSVMFRLQALNKILSTMMSMIYILAKCHYQTSRCLETNTELYQSICKTILSYTKLDYVFGWFTNIL